MRGWCIGWFVWLIESVGGLSVPIAAVSLPYCFGCRCVGGGQRYGSAGGVCVVFECGLY